MIGRLGTPALAALVVACAALEARPPTEAETVQAMQAACRALPAGASPEVREVCKRLAAIDPTKLPGSDDDRQIPAASDAG
jgi:hypothetical protein